MYSPCQDYKAVQSVPGIVQICIFAVQSHGDDLDDHFNGEESEDEVVKVFQDLTPGGGASLIVTRLVHS